MILDFFFDGDIGEVIVFNANLTTTQREGLRHVLANKWGLGMAETSSSAYSSDTMTGGAGADRFVYTQLIVSHLHQIEMS